jgi:hypothetical protein
MKLLRVFGAVLLVLVASSCTKTDGTAASAASTTAPASAVPNPADMGDRAACRTYDAAFDLLINDEATEATGELGDTSANPAAALGKINKIIEAYAAKVEQAKSKAQDPALVTALGQEATGAKATITQLGSPKGGESVHVLWTKYFLNTGQPVAKLCPNETLLSYHRVDEMRKQFG